MLRWLKSVVFRAARPLVVENVDRNEDFVCGYCCEPVLTRVLYCSDKCARDQALSHAVDSIIAYLDKLEAAKEPKS